MVARSIVVCALVGYMLLATAEGGFMDFLKKLQPSSMWTNWALQNSKPTTNNDYGGNSMGPEGSNSMSKIYANYYFGGGNFHSGNLNFGGKMTWTGGTYTIKSENDRGTGGTSCAQTLTIAVSNTNKELQINISPCLQNINIKNYKNVLMFGNPDDSFFAFTSNPDMVYYRNGGEWKKYAFAEGKTETLTESEQTALDMDIKKWQTFFSDKENAEDEIYKKLDELSDRYDKMMDEIGKEQDGIGEMRDQELDKLDKEYDKYWDNREKQNELRKMRQEIQKKYREDMDKIKQKRLKTNQNRKDERQKIYAERDSMRAKFDVLYSQLISQK